MSDVDREGLHEIAANCVALVEKNFGEHLDWSLESLEVLDHVCVDLIREGPLSDKRLDLWSKLVGAYLGEVLVRAYDGEWITYEKADWGYAAHALGVTAFPFATARRVLIGEDGKSLAPVGQLLPVIAARSEPPV